MNAEKYVGKAPVGISALSGPELVVFNIDGDRAITAFYAGDGVYEDFSEDCIREDGDRSCVLRYGQKYYFDEIVRTGTPWLKDLPVCRQVRN